MSIETRRAERKRRHVRSRKNLSGTAERPRLGVEAQPAGKAAGRVG